MPQIIVDVIAQVEADSVLGVAGARDGNGLIDELCNTRRVKGRGYYARAMRVLKPLLLRLGLAQDDTVYAELERAPDHIGLIAAQNYAVGVVKQKRLAARHSSSPRRSSRCPSCGDPPQKFHSSFDLRYSVLHNYSMPFGKVNRKSGILTDTAFCLPFIFIYQAVHGHRLPNRQREMRRRRSRRRRTDRQCI